MNPTFMKKIMNKYLIVIITLILSISSIIFIFSYGDNEIELESFINDKKIEYGSIENIISERKALDSTIWKDEVLAQLYEQSVVTPVSYTHLRAHETS